MFDALYVAASGMRGQQLQIDTIAHNLANLNTVGFRRGVVSFQEMAAALAANQLDATQAANTLVAPRSTGVTSSVAMSSLMGDLKRTGEPLDVAIDGLGFIEVTREDGTPAYTRAGKLRTNVDGLLAAQDGSPLAGRIEIPSDARRVEIQANGRVVGVVGDDEQTVELGQIDLIKFANPAGLRAAGANLYVADTTAGEPQIAAPGEMGMGSLKQGYLEASNVQMADELVTMMVAQRAFELNSRVVQAADQMMSITNGLYR